MEIISLRITENNFAKIKSLRGKDQSNERLVDEMIKHCLCCGRYIGDKP